MIGLNFSSMSNANELNNTSDQEGDDGTLFTLVTDGLLVLLFFAKMSTGLFYLIKTSSPPSMGYENTFEYYGKLKWHT